MELNEKLDRQISLAVREVVVRLSRDEVPDVGYLALAIASGETAQTLADKAKEKIDRRTAKPEATVKEPPAQKAAPTNVTAPEKPQAPQPPKQKGA